MDADNYYRQSNVLAGIGRGQPEVPEERVETRWAVSAVRYSSFWCGGDRFHARGGYSTTPSADWAVAYSSRDFYYFACIGIGFSPGSLLVLISIFSRASIQAFPHQVLPFFWPWPFCSFSRFILCSKRGGGHTICYTCSPYYPGKYLFPAAPLL
jgi:hypothetical protein